MKREVIAHAAQELFGELDRAVREAPGEAGDRVGGYEVVDRAPVEYIHGSQVREVGGRLVPGRWSDPWWAYAADLGWAVVKRWRSAALAATRRSPAVPALDEAVTEPWTPQQ